MSEAVTSLSQEYLDYLDSVRGLSPATRLAYTRDLHTWEEFLAHRGRSLVEATRAEAGSFLAWLGKSGLSSASVNRNLSCLRGFYRYLQKSNQIRLHPLAGMRGLKRSRHLPSVLFEKEILRLLEVSTSDSFQGCRDRALFEVMYATGCRVSEICGLSLSDLRLLDHPTLGNQLSVVGKGRKERVVFLTASAVGALKEYLVIRESRVDTQDALAQSRLFLNARGQALGVRGVAKILARAVRKAALVKKVSPHTLRHTFATHLLNEGLDIRVVQELLGHSRLETTQIYTHLSLDHLRDVVRQAHPHG